MQGHSLACACVVCLVTASDSDTLNTCFTNHVGCQVETKSSLYQGDAQLLYLASATQQTLKEYASVFCIRQSLVHFRNCTVLKWCCVSGVTSILHVAENLWGDGRGPLLKVNLAQ